MRVLFLCHNHPSLQAGGTEVFARNLFRELRDRHGVEGLFLAAVTSTHREWLPGTMVQSIGEATDELLLWLDHFDRFFLSQPDTYGLASLVPLIEQLAPDIVHVHHTLQLGVETLDLLRRLLPRAQFIFTAHDFFPLCAQEGQLLTTDGRLCTGPSLDGCLRCFPGRPAGDLVMRDLQMRDVLADFARILVPSDFARGRYLAAGWSPDRFSVMPNGVPDLPAAPHRRVADGRRDRFGFFGHINRFKGSLMLLRASRLLTGTGVAHGVALHGGAAYQSEAFMAEFDADLAAAPDASFRGAYAPEDLAGLMEQVDWVVIPSIWWENAPLVVQEAFRHRRPVICSGVGGTAEMVRDGIDGLHAPIKDPAGLAAVMRRAIETPGLWDSLVAGIVPPTTVGAAARDHLMLYQAALAEAAV
ncbi:glycosyltransferase family 4 protein [Paeniroseomonas aquatica]|uniref:Glycosyltransferase family 4 protein n=1 Tax=Paeniroseomonas aquatica TaxID=373043 RepID=A0ABT8A7J5_9PROT|nr:glycosyltransferase family 4 protein [Paeniroseomonas aquatica]MDN3565684.1 glycosyltransferase family 4 protein [Paeniroseomonas aquatica]